MFAVLLPSVCPRLFHLCTGLHDHLHHLVHARLHDLHGWHCAGLLGPVRAWRLAHARPARVWYDALSKLYAARAVVRRTRCVRCDRHTACAGYGCDRHTACAGYCAADRRETAALGLSESV